MGPMRRILLAATFASATWFALPAWAGSQDCAFPKGGQAVQSIHSVESWTALREFHREFHMCDDRFLAVTIGETVIDLLDADPVDLGTLNDLVASDDGFRTFVLRHVDELALPSELRRVVEKLRHCPRSATRLCQDIEERAELAMRTLPWGDGPHRCSSEMGHRVEGIAGLSASWGSFHEIYEIYHMCDDGSVGAGFSYAVVSLLGREGGDLITLNELASADDSFRTFVLRHIDELSYRSELEPVVENAIDCPSGAAQLCNDIREAAEDAITRAED